MINDLKNVCLFNAGLGEAEKDAFLDCFEANGDSRGGLSKIVAVPAEDKSFQKTRLVSFDSILPQERRVTVVQLDLEGYELQALRGAINTIRREKPILILETVPKDPWFTDNILALGYSRKGTLHDRNTIFHCT